MNSHKVLPRRFFALVIDSLILSAINAAIYFPIADKQADIIAEAEPGEQVTAYVNFGDYSLTGGKAGLFMLGSLVLTLLYWVVLPGRTGWTPGKAMLGLRIVRSEDGTTPPGMMRAFVRYILWIADMFPYLIPGLTGFIAAITDGRRRRIGDRGAGTEVVKASAVGSRHEEPAREEPVERAPAPAMGTQAMPAIPVSKPEPPPVPVPASGPPADWYPDPHGQKRLRYWDGTAWTDHTAD